MRDIAGLDKKEFVVTIEWVVDADVLLGEGTEGALDHLQETGSADITNLELRDKEAR